MDSRNCQTIGGHPSGAGGTPVSLATQLVINAQPLESVAAVLGHCSVESTRLYTHLDCEALSCVALDPEQVLS